MKIKNFERFINESDENMSVDLNPVLLNKEKKVLEFTEFQFKFPNAPKNQYYRDNFVEDPEFILRVYSDGSNTFHYADGVEINTHAIDNVEYGEELIKYHIAILKYLGLDISDFEWYFSEDDY